MCLNLKLILILLHATLKVLHSAVKVFNVTTNANVKSLILHPSDKTIEPWNVR